MIAEAWGNPANHVPTGGVPRPDVLRGPQNRALIEDRRINAGPAQAPEQDPLKVQVSGDHYKKLRIQPVEYIHANGIGFCEGAVIKYVSRWRDKGGIKDLEKARHFIDLLINLESKA